MKLVGGASAGGDAAVPRVYPDPRLRPWPSFEVAAAAAVQQLHRQCGLDLWLVTRVEGDRQVVIASTGASAERVPAGTELSWPASPGRNTRSQEHGPGEPTRSRSPSATTTATAAATATCDWTCSGSLPPRPPHRSSRRPPATPSPAPPATSTPAPTPARSPTRDAPTTRAAPPHWTRSPLDRPPTGTATGYPRPPWPPRSPRGSAPRPAQGRCPSWWPTRSRTGLRELLRRRRTHRVRLPAVDRPARRGDRQPQGRRCGRARCPPAAGLPVRR